MKGCGVSVLEGEKKTNIGVQQRWMDAKTKALKLRMFRSKSCFDQLQRKCSYIVKSNASIGASPKPTDWIKYWAMISFSSFLSLILTHSWGKIWHYNLATNPVVCFQRNSTQLPTYTLPYSLASLANITDLCLGWRMSGVPLRPHLARILIAIYLGSFHRSSKKITHFSVLWISSALIPFACIKQIDRVTYLNIKHKRKINSN